MAQDSSEFKTERSHTFLFWSSGVEPSRGWDDWIDIFNREMSVKHKTNPWTQTDISQGSTITDLDLLLKAELFFALGREGQKKLLDLGPDFEISRMSYMQLKNEAQNIFQTYQNVTKQRVALFSRTQKENETSEMFFEHLRSLASSCEFGNLQESIVRDVFIANTRDKQLKEELCKVTVNPEDFVRTVINREPVLQQQVEITDKIFKFETGIEPTRCFVDGKCSQGHSPNCCPEKESELFDCLIGSVQKNLGDGYEKTVITLPTLPDCISEKYPYILRNTMSDRRLYDYLVKQELKGVLLRDVSRLVNTGVAKNVGVLFLNFEVSFDKFVLVKRIPISKSGSVEDTFDLLALVIQSLDVLVDTFLQGREMQCCQPFTFAIALVVPRLYGYANDSKDACLRTCHEIVCKLRQLQSSFLGISVNCFAETKTDFLENDDALKKKKSLGNWMKALPGSISGFLPSLLLDNILTEKNDVIKLKLSERLYHSSGGQDLTLTNQQSVLNKFDEIFPLFYSELEIVPNLNKIDDNIMYSTDPEGGMLSTKLNEISGYLGETQLFPLTFISKLKSPCGVFLKNWTSKKFESFLIGSEGLNIPFQIDWLYCGPNCVALFEVGLVSGEHASTIVRNKLEQVLDCHVQKMLLISIPIMQILETEEHSILKFFSDHFKFFIYLPNVPADSLKRAIEQINCNKKKGENKELFARLQKGNSLSNHVNFLVHTENTSYKNLPECYAIKLNTKGELFLSEERMKIEKMFNPSITVADSKALRFVEAILTFGLLAKDDCIELPDHKAADIETKYQGNQQRWVQRHKKRSFFNIILSPQQYSILDRNHSHVCLMGEPGTGKTSLLLAKAIRESENPQIHHTFFVVPATKFALFNAVKSYLDGIKSSVVVIRAESYKDLLKQLKEKWMTDDPSMFQKSAMVVDEAYFNDLEKSSGIFETKLFTGNIRTLIYLKVKTCWLARVVLGRDTWESDLDSYKETFEIETLNTTFRNSHHISLLTHSYIHKQKKIDESTAMVHGCFTSSQNSIQTDTFSNYHDPKLTGKNFLSPQLAEDRIVIVFTIPDSELVRSELVQNYGKEVQKQQFVVYRTAKGLIFGSDFAGIEAKSVLIIIDKEFVYTRGFIDIDEFDDMFFDGYQRFDTNFNLLVLAINRAQYEVGVLIHEKNSCRAELAEFFAFNSKRHIVLEYVDLMYAKNDSSPLSDLTGVDASDLVSVLLYRPNSNFENWLQLLKKISSNSKVELLLQMTKVYERNGPRKEDVGKFIAGALRMHKDIFPEFFFVLLQYGNTILVNVLHRLLKQSPSDEPLSNFDFLSTLCERGSGHDMRKALRYLNDFNLLDCNLNKIYGSGHTNLTLLCQRLLREKSQVVRRMQGDIIDTSQEFLLGDAMDAIDAVCGFMEYDSPEHPLSDSTLHQKVDNMNVFELAIHLNVFPMIYSLLENPRRCQLFLDHPNDSWKTEHALCKFAECLTTGIKDGDMDKRFGENKSVAFVERLLGLIDDNTRGILLEKMNMIELFLDLKRRDFHRAIEITEKFGFSQRQIELLTAPGRFSIHDLVVKCFTIIQIAYYREDLRTRAPLPITAENDLHLQVIHEFTGRTHPEIQASATGLLDFFHAQIRSGELEFLVRFTDAANEFYEGHDTSLITRMLEFSKCTLFSACYNSTPRIVEWAVKLLQKHGRLEIEMHTLCSPFPYPNVSNFSDHQSSMRDNWKCSLCKEESMRHTVLTILCTIENASVESVEVLLKNNFPPRLLNQKPCPSRRCTQTACELAENRGKPEIAEAIRKYKKEQDELEQQQQN